MWRIIAILLSIAGAVSSNPGAGAEGAPMVPTIQCECDCGIVQSVSTSDTYYGKVDENDLMNEHIYKETDGTVSEGQSKDGLTYREREGTCTWVDGNVYDGDLLFGKPHGDGKMKYKDGSEYDGKWYADKRHGKGKMKYTDGSEYVGGWLEGKRHGAGTETIGQLYRYQGGWSCGKKHGRGVDTFYWDFLECEVEYDDGQLVDIYTRRFPLLLRFAATDIAADIAGLILAVIILGVRDLFQPHFGLVRVLVCFWMGRWAARRGGSGRCESDSV